MPQKHHQEWSGFARLRKIDKDKKFVPGVPPKARCLKCGKTMSKTSQSSLRTHKNVCGKEVKNKKKAASIPSPEDDDPSWIEEELSSENEGTPRRPAMETEVDHSSSDSIESSSESSRSSTPLVTPSLSFHSQRTSSLSSDSSFLEEPRVVRKKPSVKRKKNYENNNEEGPTDDEKAIALYKYFLSSNTPYDSVRSPAFMKLLNVLDPHFDVPSSGDELRDSVGLKVADQIYVDNQSKQHTQVMQLIVQIIKGRVEVEEGGTVQLGEDKILAMTLLGSTKGEWTFVKRLELYVDPLQDYSSQIDLFCDESVLEVKKEYNINVLFLLHSGKQSLPAISTIQCPDEQEIKYYKVCEVAGMLHKLNVSLICNSENYTAVSNFYNHVPKTLVQSIEQENLSMSEAVGQFFNIFKDLDEANRTIVSDGLVQVISPIHLSTRIFNPKMHKDYLTESLEKVFSDFQMEYGPEEFAHAVSYYMQKKGNSFNMLFKQNRVKDPVKFWEVVMLDKNIDNIHLLAEYAIQLMHIPAKLMDIDLIDLFNKRNSHVDNEMDDFDNVFFSILLQ